MLNHHGGMIVLDGPLYGAHGGNEGGFLSCLNFQTGEVLCRDRDGMHYLRAEDGELLLIEPSRKGILLVSAHHNILDEPRSLTGWHWST